MTAYERERNRGGVWRRNQKQREGRDMTHQKGRRGKRIKVLGKEGAPKKNNMRLTKEKSDEKICGK